MEYFIILPLEITLDVLTRLPTESVLDCKLVCKQWRNLVSHHPSFSKMHLNHLNDSTDDYDSGKLSFLLRSDEFYYFDYTETNSIIKKIDLTSLETSHVIGGSCNGLICNLKFDGSIVISNPIIKEYVILPEPRTTAHIESGLFCGFGYLPITDEYKVVRMCKLYEESFEVEVYTLGSGNGWRNVGKIEFIVVFTEQIGVFANGAIYWLDCREKVVAFNLADEKFYDIPIPPIIDCDYLRLVWDITIRALGDSLWFVDDKIVEGVRTIDRWLLEMKDGLHEMKEEVDCNWVCWSEEFSVLDKGMRPFAFTKSGAVLCIKYLNEHFTLYRYDIETSSLEMLASFDGWLCQLPSPHMKTLVSLRDLGEENTEIMESSLGTKSSN